MLENVKKALMLCANSDHPDQLPHPYSLSAVGEICFLTSASLTSGKNYIVDTHYKMPVISIHKNQFQGEIQKQTNKKMNFWLKKKIKNTLSSSESDHDIVYNMHQFCKQGKKGHDQNAKMCWPICSLTLYSIKVLFMFCVSSSDTMS